MRALDVLRECDAIAAEDTRVARKLLSALELPGKRLLSYREQNAARVTPYLLEIARAGTLALTTDAGTPGISDPGRDLLVAARAAGIAVEVLPGPVAFVTAAVLSGFDLTGMRFGGFLPKGTSRRNRALREALECDGVTAFYESPHRIVRTLNALAELHPSTTAFVARELTKRFEEHLLGTPEAILAELREPRGEFVLLIDPPGNSTKRKKLRERAEGRRARDEGKHERDE